jgi:drug/metabolite transporter (DMT)-like permease
MDRAMDRSSAFTEASLVLAAVFWGTNYAATKYAAEFVPPLPIVGIRFTVGGLLMSCCCASWSLAAGRRRWTYSSSRPSASSGWPSARAPLPPG